MREDGKRSFSAQVKDELARLPLGKSCCMLSEISALTQTTGHLAFRGGGGLSVSYRMEHTGAARRLFLLLKRRLNVAPLLQFTQTFQLGGQRMCVLSLEGRDAEILLTALHMMETDSDGNRQLKRTVPRHPMTRQCCRRAFFRGAFLGAGTLTSPEKDYHFEWKAEDEHLPETLRRLLEKSGLVYHAYKRKEQTVVYIKNGQEIADLLTLMGAARSVLAMENIRAGKQLRASAIRAANCDEHNGERSLDAALSQMEAIRRISLKQGLFTLPPALQELARLRLEHPELNLQELGERMNPRLSKSGVNNRFRRIMRIAEALEREGGEND